MSKSIILLGSGGHAKVLLDCLHRLHCPLLGIVDPHLPTGSEWQGLTVLGDDNAVFNYPMTDIELINGIGSLPNDKGVRACLYGLFSDQGYCFKTLVDPSAFIAASVELSAGVQVMAGAIIQAGAKIAENTIINSGAIVEHDCRIAQHVHIAPGAVLSGAVEVGNFVHIGTGATIIQGITIGSGCIIGAGSVITRNIACNQIVYPHRSHIKPIT